MELMNEIKMFAFHSRSRARNVHCWLHQHPKKRAKKKTLGLSSFGTYNNTVSLAVKRFIFCQWNWNSIFKSIWQFVIPFEQFLMFVSCENYCSKNVIYIKIPSLIHLWSNPVDPIIIQYQYSHQQVEVCRKLLNPLQKRHYIHGNTNYFLAKNR